MASVAAAIVGSAAIAQEATDTGTIVINAEVLPYVAVFVITPSMSFEATDPLRASNNTGQVGTTVGVHRARFLVESNSNYNLVITNSSGCWTAPNQVPGRWASFPHVKFESPEGNWMGSQIDLDRNPDSVGVTYEWNNTDRAASPSTFTTNCNIVSGTYPPESHQWALAAQFTPRITGNAANPNGIAGALAPPGVYSTTAIITASTTP